MKNNNSAVIKSPSVFDAAVDIIVPYHGQYEKTLALIESIFKFTRSNYYHLYVVDDFSPNDNFLKIISNNARKRSITNFKAMRCSTQRGFAGACQVAVDRSENPYICCVNSDCLVEDIGWLREMGESLLEMKSQGVRMVTPRTDNPVNGDEAQRGEKGKFYENVVVPSDSFLSLYCFLCHRELFRRCGGFLKNYPFGGYEDEEFGYRMNKYGFRQGVAGKAWIHHEGEATIKSLWEKSVQIKKIMQEENRDRCIQDMRALAGKK